MWMSSHVTLVILQIFTQFFKMSFFPNGGEDLRPVVWFSYLRMVVGRIWK